MRLTETGKIRDIKKIIARIEGLPSCLNGQLVDLGDGARGIVMGFDEDDVLVLVLGDENKLRIGKEVTGVNEPFTIPVGEKFIGRMVNALGEPCDGKSPATASDHRQVFRESPTIIDRAPVNQYLHTGTKVIDTFIPLARGQRQLLIGDRMTGKTTIAIDAILNQKRKDVLCIYCCIGKSMSALEKAVSIFQAAGALEYTIIMIALDSAPVGEQYLLPYASASMGDYFAEKGRDVLVVYDDLTKHAWAYRQLSLLLERPPGREAYPGDIFYVHTQLLERAGKLAESRGGGTMTFLGVAETLEGDLTGFIPSNLISMCDGLVFLSNSLFGEGMRPAVDFSLSVSIVGGKTQPPILRSLASKLRVQYAQYSEVTKLSKLQTSMSAEAEQVLKRGEAIVAILQQGQYSPVSLEEELLLIYAVHAGKMDNLAAGQKAMFVKGLMRFAREVNPDLIGDLCRAVATTPEMEQAIDALLDQYLAVVAAEAGESEKPEEEEA